MFAYTVLLCVSLMSLNFSSISAKKYYDLKYAEYHFEEFLIQHNKVYSEDEKLIRLEYFKSNLEEVNRRNMEEKYAEFDIQEFSDLSGDEFENKYTCLMAKKNTDDVCNVVTTIPSGQAPEEFDWRDKNAVTPVKDQQSCRSCWSFSATGNMEGQYAIKYGKLQSFSEQQLVDCDDTSDSCNGGLMTNALKYYQTFGGAETEADYPYVAQTQTCKFNQSKVVAKVASCNEYHLSLNDEENIKTLLYQNGPLAIGIAAKDVETYTKGVLLSCSEDTPNHGVLLVGYGTDKLTRQPYWIVKNSWGSKWGENGFFRVKRGGNPCGFINNAMCSAVVA